MLFLYSSHSVNHHCNSSSEWRPVLSEYENVSLKHEVQHQPPNTFIPPSDIFSVRHDISDTQKLPLGNQLDENALIQHLTDQIINLNQWRETAILEAVEKDR